LTAPVDRVACRRAAIFPSLSISGSWAGCCFSGDFSRKPAEMTVADVSVVSSELFDIIVNDSSPEISTEIPTAEASPVTEAAAGPLARQRWMAPPRNWRKI
jgi:hypothetical protein